MRKIININEGWKFSKNLDENYKNLEVIKLPHTWNNFDGTDGGNDYYRGKCVYYKEIDNLNVNPDECAYLEFNGVNQSSEVYFNDQKLGVHQGGYSTFRYEITSLIKEHNLLKVYVDNSQTRTIYPQKADFTFYGGIYRDVNLIITNKIHFDLDYYGGNGLKISTLNNGTINLTCYLNTDEKQNLKIEIFNQENELVLSEEKITNGKIFNTQLVLTNPHLWNGVSDPYLYLIKLSLNNDDISHHFGFREFKVDPNQGFILNEKNYPLIGVSRHQDKKNIGSALTKLDHEEDIALIKEMGANTIRLAHYQHDQYFYDLCDKNGLIIWAEIPYISEHMEEANANSESQLKELIIQNYNHPSIICWGLSNEITVTGGMSEECLKNHQRLNKLAHDLDTTRLTTMANLFMLETNSPLLTIPDIRSYNLYYGWYTGELKDNEIFFDKFHDEHPSLAIGLSEYGADCNVAYQGENPTKGDYSEGYQALYHEHILKMKETRPYIWALHAWNMFDFGADGRDEGGKKGENQKGLVTFDRKIKKDAFYIYKAYLSKEPFIHLCGKRYIYRECEETEIKVYSNLNEVSLYVDDKLIDTKCGEHIFTFKIKNFGKQHIKVVSNQYVDEMNIIKVDSKYPGYISPTQMKVINWFDKEKNINPAYFSIKDTVKDIKNHPQAGAIYARIMMEAMKKIGDVAKGVQIPQQMQEKMDNMTLEANLKMAGHMINGEMVDSLNNLLQKIKK